MYDNCYICVKYTFHCLFRLSLIEEDFEYEDEDELDIEDYDDEDSDGVGAVSLVRRKQICDCVRVSVCPFIFVCSGKHYMDLQRVVLIQGESRKVKAKYIPVTALLEGTVRN